VITKGQKINDRYQIIKSIGEGGMANVYLAYDTILERNVAVKVLRGDLANDEKFVRRFQREALSASSLSHPNIVEVYDVGEDNGVYYIVMEYIEGRHLKQLLKKRGKLTMEEAVDIMLQVSDGLACAHDSYIIHRDIKPQNIMILENGMVKITDFGIAMALNSTQLTQTNSVMGSVHYLPPEQASGKGCTIQSDIYSMGILFYELLTGTLPYKGDNAVEIALKHLKEPLPSIRKELPNIPQSVENIILRSAAKNPKNRYADAREMHDDLKTCLDPSRANEKPYVYKYPEFDVEDTAKKEKAIEKTMEFTAIKVDDDKTPEVEVKKITEKDLKQKENKTLLILGAILAGLAIITTCIVLLIPKLTSSKDVIVPDVTGKSTDAAVKILTKNGLKVAAENKTATSDTIDEGKVVKTDPSKGRTVKSGATITIYESLGAGTVTLEDYTGQNYLEVKAILEKVDKLFVVVEKQTVDDTSGYTDGQIIKQSPEKGSKVKAGDTVKLYVPDLTQNYPDFTKGDYTLSDIQAWCDKYGVTLKEEYVEKTDVTAGTIISQSRAAGSEVISGMTLTITISSAPDTGDQSD
jgi:eukaryotic-like serine/threonine-protein kinase